jgi:hypothetical protein
MAGAAAFSMRAWMPSAAFDPIEDGLHSFAATAMGFSFALGVLVQFSNVTDAKKVDVGLMPLL